ncbi:ArsR/SmtB family transcription factor [Nocardioides sp. GCM10027113]|uniref:ArsR/SmtB family transcription factor n=1 Tax=unclassified Nocardioides TaxID=2615069 RepID=UPI0036136AE1
MSTPKNRHLRDPRELAALAHPVRVGILELLAIHGPLTATALGDFLDENPANCSWHLRKLAEHGFVEEAGGGHGRQRPWRTVHLGFNWGDEDTDPSTRPTADALSRMMLERWLDRFYASLTRAAAEEPEWNSARSMTQTATWLTAEELAAMNHEVSELLRKYRDRLADPDQRPEGSRLCEFVAWGAPIELETTP